MSAQHTTGPFVIDSFGDWMYVVSEEGGVRMAEVDGDNARHKAEQVCAALNAMHYIAQAAGSAS